MKVRWNLRAALAMSVALIAAAPSLGGYHLIRRVVLGGEGGWDYLTVDEPTHRLFISRATRVLVVDADSGKQVGEIPDMQGIHGIALVPELGRGFTSNGKESTASIFDLKTLGVMEKVNTGENPDAIL